MTPIRSKSGKTRSLAAVAGVLLLALVARIVAAWVVQSYVERLKPPRLCVFPDTNYYWLLARAIRHGGPYEIVEYGTISFKALRTPGYPLFLAVCQAVMGHWPLGVRLVQAVLGMASVGLVYLLTRRFESSLGFSTARWSGRTASLAAATLAAINPYYIAMSELLLSEALFVPLMLLALWGVAELWREPGESDRSPPGRRALVALGAGAAGGAATLVKPSFALFLPAVIVIWLLIREYSREWRRADRERARAKRWGVTDASSLAAKSVKDTSRSAFLVLLGAVLVMSPWWVRNAQTYGRFVPTSVWFGASLYDGLNPQATGASDMRFREEPDIRVLGEVEQDAALERRAFEFVRSDPLRVLQLAGIKFGRYFSPWPNAEEIRSPWATILSAAIVIPMYCLIIAGVRNRRRDRRALVILAGPLVYFCVVHLVFVSSIRYRIPAEMVATSLAGIGFRSLLERVAGKTNR